MTTKKIPLTDLAANPTQIVIDCANSGTTLVIELPDHRLVAMQPIQEDDDSLIDDLIAHNDEFRRLLAESAASPHRPFVAKFTP